MKQADVIVVGAGPAGCGAAYDLADYGFDVILLDKAHFPRQKPCAGGLTVKSLKTLRYSVKPVIRNICTDVRISKGMNHCRIFRCNTPMVGMTVRPEFDQYCLEKTIAKGVKFEIIDPIKAITQSEGVIQLSTTSSQYSARYLVGADGANSIVRKLTGAFPKPVKGLAIEGLVDRSDFPESTMELTFGELKCGYGWIFPKHDHLNVGLYTNDPVADKISKKSLEAYVKARLGDKPINHIVGHYIGLGGGKQLPGSGRVLLCGDAAGYVDPIIGEGIYYAIKSGQVAALAINESKNDKVDAAGRYNELMQPFLYDLRGCYKAADWLYENTSLAMLGLQWFPAKSVFLKSFAHGLTLVEMKKQMPYLPFMKWGQYAHLLV